MFEVNEDTVTINRDMYVRLLQEGCPIVVGGKIISNKTNYPYFIESDKDELTLIVEDVNEAHNEKIMFLNEKDIIDGSRHISNLIGHNSTFDYLFKIDETNAKYIKYYDQKYLDLLTANRIEFECTQSYSRKLLLDNVLSPSSHHFLITDYDDSDNDNDNYEFNGVECEDMIIVDNTEFNFEFKFTNCNIKQLSIVNLSDTYPSGIIINDVRGLNVKLAARFSNNNVKIIGNTLMTNHGYIVEIKDVGHIEINNSKLMVDFDGLVSLKSIDSIVKVCDTVVFSDLIVEGLCRGEIYFGNIKFNDRDSLLKIDADYGGDCLELLDIMPTNNFMISVHGSASIVESRIGVKKLMLDNRYDFRFSKILTNPDYGLSKREINEYNYCTECLGNEIVIGAEYLKDKINITDIEELDLTINKELNDVDIYDCTITNLNIPYCSNVRIFNCKIEGSVKIGCKELTLSNNIKVNRNISVEIDYTKLTSLKLSNLNELESHMIDYDIMTEIICGSDLNWLELDNAMITGTINVDQIKRVKLFNCPIMHLINRYNDTIEIRDCIINRITKTH